MARIRIKQTVWIAALLGCSLTGCSGLQSPLGVQTDQEIALRGVRTKHIASIETQAILRGGITEGGTNGRVFRDVGDVLKESDMAHIKRDEQGRVRAIGRPALKEAGGAEDGHPSLIITPEPARGIPE